MKFCCYLRFGALNFDIGFLFFLIKLNLIYSGLEQVAMNIRGIILTGRTTAKCLEIVFVYFTQAFAVFLGKKS